MGVPDHAEISSGAVACAFFKSGSEAFRYFLAGGVNFFVGRASDILNEVGESVDESLMSLHGSIVFAGETGELKNGSYVEHEIIYNLVEHNKLNAFKGEVVAVESVLVAHI